MLILLLCSSAAQAIETGQSEASFTLGEGTLSGYASFAWQDIDAVLEIDLDRDGHLTAKELSQSLNFLSEYGETLYHCASGEEVLEATKVTHHFDEDSGSITFDYLYQTDETLAPAALKTEFAGHRDFPVGHQQHLQVLNSAGKVLSRQRVGDANTRPLFPTPAPIQPAPSTSTVPANFISNDEVAKPSLGTIPMILLSATLFLIALMACTWFIRRPSAA